MPETGVMKEVVMNSGDSTMKCREMNPGNSQDEEERTVHGTPSMKCREMNPGNLSVTTRRASSNCPLNEVPGEESRQSPH